MLAHCRFTLTTRRCSLPTQSELSRRKAIRDELTLLRGLAKGRRVASTLMPELRRTALQVEPGAVNRKTRTPPSSLTADEEVTLRRVAYGESTARTMRARDLVTLRNLMLIADHRDGPLLTAKGRQLFDTLPRAAGQSSQEPYDAMLAELARITQPGRG